MRPYQQFFKSFLISAIVVVLATSLFSVGLSTARGEDFSANVKPLGGLVQHQSGGGVWQTITDVTLLKPGDKLRTADMGAAEINTSAGITVRVYPNTLIELD